MSKFCEQCENCMYLENGDMFCDEHKDSKLVYEDFCPTKYFMWCKGKKFQER